MKKLSVVVLVYDTEKYLPKCLDSIIDAIEVAKLEKESEIIVINDGSPDNSEQIILEYQNKYRELIKKYTIENIGRTLARKLGIEKSAGEYISFVDSDDFIDVNWYKAAFEKIKVEKADIVVCDIENIIEGGSEYRTEAIDKNETNTYLGILKSTIMPSVCNKVFKKDLWDNIEFPNTNKYEDLAMTLMVLLKTRNISYIPQMYYKYLYRIGSAMRVEFNKQKFELLSIIKDLKYNLEKKYPKQADELMCSIYLWRLYSEFILPISRIKDKSYRNELSIQLLENIYELHNDILKFKYYKLEKEKLFKIYKWIEPKVNKAIKLKSLSELNKVYKILNIYDAIKGRK